MTTKSILSRMSILPALILATIYLSGAVASAPAKVDGVWISTQSDKNSATHGLRLALKQDGYWIRGYFRKGWRRWKAVGAVNDNGVLHFFRWVPVTELELATRLGKDRALVKYGIKGTDYLIAPVSLQLSKNKSSLNGDYTIVAVKNDQKVFLETKKISLKKKPSAALLVDKDTRFHRLFLVGPGYSPKEKRLFLKEAGELKDLLDSKRIGHPKDTSELIFPRLLSSKQTPTQLSEYIAAIKDIPSKLEPGDQVLIYISAHGWGGAYSNDYTGVYKARYERYRNYYILSNTNEDEQSLLKQEDELNRKLKSAKLSERQPLLRRLVRIKELRERLHENFRKVFAKMIRDGKIKKTEGKEFYWEGVHLTDPDKSNDASPEEYLLDHKFAQLVEPIVDGSNPLTVIMDSCFGGGFADNLKNIPEIRVLGLRIICPSPTSGSKSLTRHMIDLIKYETNGGKTAVKVSADDGLVKLETVWPGKVGPPRDDSRDPNSDP